MKSHLKSAVCRVCVRARKKASKRQMMGKGKEQSNSKQSQQIHQIPDAVIVIVKRREAPDCSQLPLWKTNTHFLLSFHPSAGRQTQPPMCKLGGNENTSTLIFCAAW